MATHAESLAWTSIGRSGLTGFQDLVNATMVLCIETQQAEQNQKLQRLAENTRNQAKQIQGFEGKQRQLHTIIDEQNTEIKSLIGENEALIGHNQSAEKAEDQWWGEIEDLHSILDSTFTENETATAAVNSLTADATALGAEHDATTATLERQLAIAKGELGDARDAHTATKTKMSGRIAALKRERRETRRVSKQKWRHVQIERGHLLASNFELQGIELHLRTQAVEASRQLLEAERELSKHAEESDRKLLEADLCSGRQDAESSALRQEVCALLEQQLILVEKEVGMKAQIVELNTRYREIVLAAMKMREMDANMWMLRIHEKDALILRLEECFGFDPTAVRSVAMLNDSGVQQDPDFSLSP